MPELILSCATSYPRAIPILFDQYLPYLVNYASHLRYLVNHICVCYPCHSDTAIAFSLEFCRSGGFPDDDFRQPTLQVAFLYSVLLRETVDADDADSETDATVPTPHTEAKGNSAEPGGAQLPRRSSNRERWVLARRLRVHTVQLELARGIRQLYEHIDDRTMMALVTQKVALAIEDEGFREGRLLLQDWLVALLSSYRTSYQVSRRLSRQCAPTRPDAPHR